MTNIVDSKSLLHNRVRHAGAGLTYERAIGVAETLYGHGRFRLPYSLVVLGY